MKSWVGLGRGQPTHDLFRQISRLGLEFFAADPALDHPDFLLVVDGNVTCQLVIAPRAVELLGQPAVALLWRRLSFRRSAAHTRVRRIECVGRGDERPVSTTRR